MASKTFLFELREAANNCTQLGYAYLLRAAADDLQGLIEELHANPTREAMTYVNGVWAYARRILENLPVEGTPAPLGGDTEPARLAA